MQHFLYLNKDPSKRSFRIGAGASTSSTDHDSSFGLGTDYDYDENTQDSDSATTNVGSEATNTDEASTSGEAGTNEEASTTDAEATNDVFPQIRPSGLKIEQVSKPDACEKTAKKGDTLTMHYTGVLQATGNKFDSSYRRNDPHKFQLGVGQVCVTLKIDKVGFLSNPASCKLFIPGDPWLG